MGEVYLALDTKLQRKVALKVLPHSFHSDPDRLNRFEREARAASALNHPHIAQIYEIGNADGELYIAMEYVEGMSLQALLARESLESTLVLRIAVQLADALQEAHAKGIIHRDLKPSNVMLSSRGQIKVLDFGLAKVQQQFDSSNVATDLKTESGMLLGTIPYMSPEQALGKPLDHRTDIFSYGTLLYTLLSSKHPFQGTTQTESLDKVLHHNPEPISKSNQLERVIRKCLEKDVRSRYQSFSEVLNALTPLNSRPQNISIGVDSRRTVVLVLLLIVLAGVVLLALKTVWHHPSRNQDVVTLAVLPFNIVTPEEKISHLSVGIPDAIITRLSNLPQMRLRPTSAILQFQNKQFDLEQVRKTLRADHVLTGTIQQSGNRFRVRVQLIRTNDGVNLWGDTYDVIPSDLLSIEDSVSHQVSSALQLKISPQQQLQLQENPTRSAQAYDLYLRGREQLLRYNTAATLNSISFFEKALEADSAFALARAGLAEASADMHIRFASDDEVEYWGHRAMEEAQRALKMNPNLAEVHEALAAVYRKTDFEWDSTIQESNLALQLNHSLYLPHCYKAAAFYHLGLFDLAQQEVNLATAFSVGDEIEALRTNAVITFFEGNYGASISNLLKVKQLTGKALADWYLAMAYYYSGNHAEAENVLRELMSTGYTGNAARAKTTLAAFLAHRGEKEEAKKMLDESVTSPLLDHHALYSTGVAYAQIGDHQQAVSWLKKATEEGFPCYPWFQKDPLLNPIRSDGAFQQLMSNLLRTYQQSRAKYGK